MRAPSNFSCLGLRLEQLSIGHLFLLADVSSPFLIGGTIAVTDLSNAVFLCSEPWRQAAADTKRWWFPLFLKLWARRSRKLDMAAEQEKFSAYFKAETEFPLSKQNSRSMREYGSPWWWRLLAIMMADFHLSKNDALDMAAAEAAMLWSARAELEGKLNLWTKADDDFDEFCKRMDADPDVQFPGAAKLN